MAPKQHGIDLEALEGKSRPDPGWDLTPQVPGLGQQTRRA